jgi:hypothetical protein
MTNLTEKWKKGELPDNHHYYFQMPNGKYEVGNTFCLETLRWCKDGDKIKVLKEVPSYEQLQEKEIMYDTTSRCNEKFLWENESLKRENTKLKTENKWYSEQLNEAVKEVAKLKELLTMVKPVLQLEYNVTENRNLIKKINQVLGEE